ncbi:MAG: hypothetical protein OXO50_13395 [Caldilineaceae bacterium]|nr:hypothetical protein [Caldilineaceae bacterium]
MIGLNSNHLKAVRQILAGHVPASEVRGWSLPSLFEQRPRAGTARLGDLTRSQETEQES